MKDCGEDFVEYKPESPVMSKYQIDVIEDEIKAVSTLMDFYSIILNETTTYKGVDFERFKQKLTKHNKLIVTSDEEFHRDYNKAVLNLLRWGLIEMRHGYLFSSDKMKLGEHIPSRIYHEKNKHNKLYDIKE